ncbi:MAG: peptidase M3 [Bacteroides sp. SM23_62_1]|nr:MAG: peptidase M3 [Bacteroides sp. SM23_62_1]
MKKLLLLSALFLVFLSTCKQKSREMYDPANPFFNAFNTPYEVPDFGSIREEHYMPAYQYAIDAHNKEIAEIIENPEPPDFTNTVEALDRSGALIRKIDQIFNNLNSSITNDNYQAIAKEKAPLLSGHKDDIQLNPALFSRIKNVYDRKESLELSAEQNMLLEETYKDFVRGGANLSSEDQVKLREINKELSVLTISFGENVLAETNDFKLIIEKEEDLSGLPEAVIINAEEAAKEAGFDGKWVFTVQKPSMIPFLQYADNRVLREKLFTAYTTLANKNNDHDNKEIITRIVSLRVEKAKLLGYENHADFVLEENMAKNSDGVYDLLDKLWDSAIIVAQKEAKELQHYIEKEGSDFKLQPWDWWYYAEKVRKEKYDLDDSELLPYFKLDNALDGVFYVCNNLYGLQINERTDIPKYHEDVRVFEVCESDGEHLGILYMDFFPRSSKRAGAWMNSFRKQEIIDGMNITPVISTVFNFSKPSGDKPSLLTFDEVSTLFHEFGHALHGLLSRCTYFKLSGTATPRDFVELPSQIMENWALHPEVMKTYALHYETGEPMPDERIRKIEKSRFFNQGFATVEYLAASFLDMDWHTLNGQFKGDVNQFEKESLDRIGLIPEIVVRYRSTYFNHIFSGGYSSGYYSYIWAEVLDSDAFEAFSETSVFDPETAKSFRENILEKGGTEDPMTLYVRFRGKEPSIEPLLRKHGLN